MQSGITLSFVSAGQSVELDSTLFRCPITSMEYRTVRGKTAHGSGRAGTFTWTAGVVGLSCTLVKAKLASLFPETDCWITATGFSSTESQFAISFDSALSKSPNWLIDMFGTDSHGMSLSRRIFMRINAERKRPGPVIVALNSHFMQPKSITIQLNGTSLSDVTSVEHLLGLLISDRAAVSLIVNGGAPAKPPPLSYQPKLRLASDSSAARPSLTGELLQSADGLPACSQNSSLSEVRFQIDRLAHHVQNYLLHPSLTDSGMNPWACADAVLAIIRHPSHRESVAYHAEGLAEIILPDTSTDSPDPPIVLATALMSFAELYSLQEIPEQVRKMVLSYAHSVIHTLRGIQAQGGWWSFVSSPLTLTEFAENARSWDTGYVTLALVHAERRGILPEEFQPTLTHALGWLERNYFPGLGWANNPKPPLRVSPELTTMLHFVLAYASQSHEISLPWRRDHAVRHARSVKEMNFDVQLMDPADYRLTGVPGAPSITPGCILPPASMLALRAQLTEEILGTSGTKDAHIDPLWEDIIEKLELSESEIPSYCQLLQATFLFSPVRPATTCSSAGGSALAFL